MADGTTAEDPGLVCTDDVVARWIQDFDEGEVGPWSRGGTLASLCAAIPSSTRGAADKIETGMV